MELCKFPYSWIDKCTLYMYAEDTPGGQNVGSGTKEATLGVGDALRAQTSSSSDGESAKIDELLALLQVTICMCLPVC